MERAPLWRNTRLANQALGSIEITPPKATDQALVPPMVANTTSTVTAKTADCCAATLTGEKAIMAGKAPEFRPHSKAAHYMHNVLHGQQLGGVDRDTFLTFAGHSIRVASA